MTRWTIIGLGTLLGCLFLGSEVFAARVIDAQISLLGGRIVLLGETGDTGKADATTVFRYLKDRVSFGGARDVAIQPDADNPLQATLTGDIKVRIDYGGEAEVKKLRLIRKKDTDINWWIHPDDVEEMLKKRK